MICYIKDAGTFATKYFADAEYDMTVHSVFDEVSTIALPGRETDVQQGDIAVLGDFLGVVKEVDTAHNMLTLTCGNIAALFSRGLFETLAEEGEGVEQYIVRVMEREFRQEPDGMYRLPYLRPLAVTHTPFVQPTIRKGVWNLREYMTSVLKHDIYTGFAVRGNELHVTIERKDRMRHKIDLGMSDICVTEEVFSGAQAARVTVMAADTGEAMDWYLMENGGVTQKQLAAGRAHGAWESVLVEQSENMWQKAQEQFEKNRYSHLIEFATEREYGFYDEVTLRTRQGRMLNTYVSSVKKRSGDSRTVYRTGELRLLIDEKLNKQDRS